MNWGWLNAGRGMELASWLWTLLMVVWLILWFGMKRAKKRETPWERLQHIVPVSLAFWLLFGKQWKELDARLFPGTPLWLWVGVVVTALGIGISIWARLSLGANWSGTVTLKKDHELIRKGLYRWIRHPIYTGMLLAFAGTELIKGTAAGVLGFALVSLSFYIKARREENFLRQEFGQGFEEHARHTGMFLPRLT